MSKQSRTLLPPDISAQMSTNTSAEVDGLNRLLLGELYELEKPIERAMELVGDKYTLQMLHLLLTRKVMRFVELEQEITGISPRTLSARLKHLEKVRLIVREQYATIPPKVEYTLTERGADLAQTLMALENWVERWYPRLKNDQE